MNLSSSIFLFTIFIICHLTFAHWEPDWENSGTFMGCFLNLRFKPYSININTNNIQKVYLPTPVHLTDIETIPVVLVNTGQSIQTTNNINPPFNDSGGPLPGTFKLLEFTFYWNRDCGKGITGTTIDGKGFCYEARALWRNSKYNTLSKAVQHADGLFEVVLLYDICSTPSSQFNAFSEKIQKLQYAGSFTLISEAALVDPANYFPANSPYYWYSGSFLDTLTGLKHKCSTVLIIKPTPQYCITEQQFKKTFSNIQNFCGDPISNILLHDSSYIQVSQSSGITQDDMIA